MNEHKENDADFMNKYGRMLQNIKSQLLKSCPAAEVLIRYFKNELTGVEKAEVAQHVDLCPVCMEALRELEEIDEKGEKMELPEKWEEIEKEMDARVYAYLKSLDASMPAQEVVLQEQLSLLSRLRMLWGSAVLFILKQRRLAYLGLTLALFFGALYAYAFLSRPDYFVLAQIEAESSAVVRGEGMESEPLRLGIQSFTQGKYEAAVKYLGNYLTKHPDHFQANYLMGLAYLLDARVELLGIPYRFDRQKVRQGIKYLENALSLAGDNAFYQEDCLWYLGKAYLMLGDLEKARQHFEQIVNFPQPNLLRRNEARNMVQKIDELSSNS